MRIHKLCFFVILIAAASAGAFAQGGAAGAPPPPPTTFTVSTTVPRRTCSPSTTRRSPLPPSTRSRCTGRPSSTPPTWALCPSSRPPAAQVKGHLFYVYYSKNGVTDKSKRPVWFLFNGGPGAATVWLHMGAFGPKMVKMAPNGLATPPPYTYVDNPNCLLDTGDLVFIDAMGTGFSRPDQPQFGPEFGGVENDLAAFGEFIRSFLNEYNLWGSPLFVGGESYGTTRAAGLAGYLTDHDIPINGVMLLSAVIDSNASAGEQRQLQHPADRNHDGAFPQEAAARSAKALGGADRQAGA